MRFDPLETCKHCSFYEYIQPGYKTFDQVKMARTQLKRRLIASWDEIDPP